MSEFKKKRTGKKPIAKTASSKAADKDQKGRRTAFVIVSAFIALMLIIIGAGYYMSEDAKYLRLTILTVDNTSIRMDYFLKRLTGTDPIAVLQRLTNEQLIKLEATRYVMKVSPEDINQELRRMAGENMTESEFREWYRQRLNESRLSDSEYKDITRTSLLSTRLRGYLAERVPTVAEQIHLHAIMLETYEDAEEVRKRWEAGEDFAALAREVSVDEESWEKGGDLGWLPRGILPYGFDEVAFNLSIGNVSEPLPDISDPWSTEPPAAYYLLMVSEKADARELDDSSLQTLKDRALDAWLSKEVQFHKISHSYNSVVEAWIKYQLAKKTGKNNSSQ